VTDPKAASPPARCTGCGGCRRTCSASRARVALRQVRLCRFCDMGYRGIRPAVRVTIHVHCIRGPCHPPQVGSGKVLLLILSILLEFKVKVLTGFVESPNQVALESKPVAAKSHLAAVRARAQ
jgi:hypothetical protein